MTIHSNLSLFLFCFTIFGTHSSYANTNQTDTNSTSTTEAWVNQMSSTLDRIPKVLPNESDHFIVPQKADTAAQTKIDERQSKFSNSLQKRAHSLDSWFGKPNPEQPASASLRIMMDTVWNKHDDLHIKPRIRGRIKLPTLQERFSIVFGDDALDNEIRDNIAITNENPIGNPTKVTDSKQYREDNASLALRWSQWKNPWDINSDLDFGIRSGDDIYVRAKLAKDWDIGHHFFSYAEQIYRYGLDSEHYVRTNLELRHARPDYAFITDQFSLIYTDNNQQDFIWENRLFRQHQFFHDNIFNYGIYAAGEIENMSPDLNSYGPFISWRQPFLRDWFFVQTDVTYYNDKAEDHDHHLGLLLRLETHFK